LVEVFVDASVVALPEAREECSTAVLAFALPASFVTFMPLDIGMPRMVESCAMPRELSGLIFMPGMSGMGCASVIAGIGIW
jgi:hypothetical protein